MQNEIEKKPSYEELLEDYNNMRYFRKQDDTITSFILGLIILTSSIVSSQISIYYSNDFAQLLNLDPTGAIITTLLLKLSQIIITVYIIWHMCFVYIVTHREEIDKWLIEHNFKIRSLNQ